MTNDLPQPAIYLPTLTGEGSKLLSFSGRDAIPDEEGFLAGVAKLAAKLMHEPMDGEALPTLVWPSPANELGIWVCQATGDTLYVDEVEDLKDEDELAQAVSWWVEATRDAWVEAITA